MTNIACDFGTRNLHLVSGTVSGKQITIDRLFIEAIPTGLVQDGVIREFAGLETTMKNILSRLRIKNRSWIVTINGTHIYSRELDVPKAVPKILSDIVSFEVRNAMTSNKDICVEYVASKLENAANQNSIHVRASAIQSEYIFSYAKLLSSLKLKPVAMDIHPNAIMKLMNGRQINDHVEDEFPVMLIDIGCVTSTAYVLSKGEILYSRIIPVGAIDIERYCLNFNSNEKPENHIALENINLSLNQLRINSSLGDAVRPLVLSITDGVNRIQQYLSGRLQGGKLNRIYMYGLGSTFEGFEETLTESLSIQVEKINKLSNVSIPQGQSPAPYLNAIGALIRLAK